MRLAHLRRQDPAEGLSPLFDSSNSPLRDLSVARLRIGDGGTYRGHTGNREVVLHLLVGRCTVAVTTATGTTFQFASLGARRDVFAGLPTTVVVGPNSSYEIRDVGRSADFAVGSAPGSGEERPPLVIRPDDVDIHEIGEGHYGRLVREVIGGTERAQRIRLGETVNPTGQWSSWPHHDFDANPGLAPQFEEVFLYFTKPASGWGLQVRHGLFPDLEVIDDVVEVRNGDAMVVPLGDHPVVAGVSSDLLYVWFYLSPIPKVYARWAEDVGGYA